MSAISIIVPFYKAYDTIENLMRSLDDQDFKDFNVTIVIDGKDDKADKQVCKYVGAKEYLVNIERIAKNRGAAAARNHGAKLSGENLESDNRNNILFFLDADCQVCPGMLREVYNQLKLNPKIDFVYGNYRFDNKTEFHSQPFDPYLMETMNYIPTMSPVRRKVFNAVGGFDEDRKYFQDWGFFYKLCRDGYKGKWINEHIFNTVSPDDESISGDQTLTLAEKADEFRKYYKITDKKIVVTTMSAQLQAIQRAKMLGADYVGKAISGRREVYPPNYFFKNWKATYMVGCFNHPLVVLEQHISVMVGKPIYHFIGTDVFQMYNTHSAAELKALKEAFSKQGAKIFANSPRCTEELRQCGFDAELLYTPIYNIDKYKVTQKLPNKFTVGVYFSDTNPMHKEDGANGQSNIPLIMDVARSMPDVEFKLFGGARRKDKENIKSMGRIPEDNMVEFINTCSMVLRSTIHDGFPQLPIQFVLCGRQALVSCPDDELKYMDKLSFEDVMEYEKAKDEIITKIYKMKDKQYDIKLQSQAAHSYYSNLMDEKKFKERIYQVLDED